MRAARHHADPRPAYDAPARGKMERFWRTLREGCLDHLGTLTSLHDGRRYVLRPVDAVAACKTRRRRPAPAPVVPAVPFEPAGALLDRLAGRPPRHLSEDASL